jgi:hypothetical protein
MASTTHRTTHPHTYTAQELRVAQGWAADVSGSDWTPQIPPAGQEVPQEAACPNGVASSLIGGAIDAITGGSSSPGCSNC